MIYFYNTHEDIPDHIKKDLKFHFAKEMTDVAKVALNGLMKKPKKSAVKK